MGCGFRVNLMQIDGTMKEFVGWLVAFFSGNRELLVSNFVRSKMQRHRGYHATNLERCWRVKIARYEEPSA